MGGNGYWERVRHKIERAKQWAEDDPHLANYALRDLEVTEKAELKDLSWAMHNDGSLHKNDVIFLIEKLEKYISEHCYKDNQED